MDILGEGQEKASPVPPPWPLAWEPREMYPHQTGHLAQGLVSKAPHSAFGRHPLNTASPLCLPFSTPFTSECDSSSTLDFLPSLLSTLFLLTQNYRPGE